jgi:uncharacterized protein
MRRRDAPGLVTRSPAGRVHAEVDRKAEPLHLLHAARLQCRRGCSSCCVDGLTVFDVEADRIRRGNVELLERGVPGPEGACAFLDADGGCRIYADRPYVCRTQGLPLRWIEGEGADAVELRDICPLNEPGTPIVELSADECWTLGPTEERLGKLQLEHGKRSDRTRLRDLFVRTFHGSHGQRSRGSP